MVGSNIRALGGVDVGSAVVEVVVGHIFSLSQYIAALSIRLFLVFVLALLIKIYLLHETLECAVWGKKKVSVLDCVFFFLISFCFLKKNKNKRGATYPPKSVNGRSNGGKVLFFGRFSSNNKNNQNDHTTNKPIFFFF